jgi:L-aspartate oxidase
MTGADSPDDPASAALSGPSDLDGTDALTADVLVLGSGVAGCAAALAAARAGADVLVATTATAPTDAASDWAQGGVGVTVSDPDAFAADVRRASVGTADPDAVDVLVRNAREAVADVLLQTLDVPFDRADGTDAPDADAPGRAAGVPTGDDDVPDLADFDLAREAGHSRRRILHVDAATGAAVLRPFLAHLADHPAVRIRPDTAALDLVTHEGRVHGAWLERDGALAPAFAGVTVLATGGIGACYPTSTNPDGATGDGVAMAALAGADVADMAYVQFHPTVAATDDPFLVSEAVRGEGAVLRSADGERFMPDRHPDADLAPRDVVARAVAAERERTGGVRLDVSDVDFRAHFPGLAAKCDDRGIDPTEGIPVEPAEHFLCGGVAVDDRGRASLDRLFAVGECARTGVHGANRLASTSLLEGLVWGLRAGEAAAGHAPERVETSRPLDSDPALPAAFTTTKLERLRRVTGEHLGLVRTESGVREAAQVLRRLKGEVDAYARTRTARDLTELRNAVVVSLLVARDAATADPIGTHHLEAPDATH